MKLIQRPTSESTRLNRKFENERLRGMRMKNTQQSVSFYVRIAITGITFVGFWTIIILIASGSLSLPNAPLAALTFTTGRVIRDFFSHRD